MVNLMSLVRVKNHKPINLIDLPGVKIWNLVTQLSSDNGVCRERDNDHEVILNSGAQP